MNHLIRKAIIRSTVLGLLLVLATGNLSQSAAAEEKGPEISVKGMSFLVREIPSTPSPLKILETHVEVYNKSREVTVPANSIKLVLVLKETKYADETPRPEFDPGVQETTITVPLPPVTGRIMTFGFSLPEKLPESMTFEIQINPPEGEKKTATWKSGKN